jgi:AcrR family transcriptional regulator
MLHKNGKRDLGTWFLESGNGIFYNGNQIVVKSFLKPLRRDIMADAKVLRKSIMEGTVEVFNEKGMKFTMDDLARKLGMSKKTIYTVFSEKEELFLAMVDYLFSSIKESEQAVMDDPNLTTVEKIRAILCVLPEGYKDVDFRQLYMLKEKYPQIYAQVEQRLETGWEQTISLIQKGIDEGVVRPIRIPVFKMMLEAALEQFFQRDILLSNKITYQEALNEVVSILVEGIEVK